MILNGVKVLDLSILLPGPMCSLFLADLGAEVIKVESLDGDPMRYFEATEHQNPYFSALNRNKKSIALNLKTHEGKKIFVKLAKKADVIIEGFRPGKVDALGVGYKEVKKINPKIVYCSITGYGQNGAYKDKAGHDLNYASLSGMIYATSSKPFTLGVQTASLGASLIAAFSIVASLLYREKTGFGKYIDLSVLDGALSLISMHLAYHSISLNQKTVLSGSKPCYNIYKTKDSKFVSLGAIEMKFWANFCSAIGRIDLAEKQFDGSKPIMDDMKNVFKSRTLKEWIALSSKHDFCCEPVKNLDEVLQDDYFKAKKMLVEIDGIKQAAMPVGFSNVKKIRYAKAPKLGEHTNELLKKIGYSKKQVMKMRAKGVVL